MKNASFMKPIRKKVIAVSQFPEQLIDGIGKFRKPLRGRCYRFGCALIFSEPDTLSKVKDSRKAVPF